MGVLHELSDADLVWRAIRNAKPKICVYYADRTPKYAFTTLRRCPPE